MTAVLPDLLATDTGWADEVHGRLRCVEVVQETPDVITAVLRPDPGTVLRFLPGQYLTVTVEVDGLPLSRCYSISSSAERTDTVSVTVKRLVDGPVSTWLHDHLEAGDPVRVDGPAGMFSVDFHPARRHLFLSAGSGITPVMSMLRTLRDRDEDSDVVFVHSARTPDDIAFRRELDALAEARDGVRVAVLCEGDSPSETWGGLRGRLHADALAMLVPDLADREVFVCGPRGYMDAARDLLVRLGADPARCHEESFVLAGADVAPVAETGERFAVKLTRSGVTLDCDRSTTLLEAAAQAGVTLASSCGEGVCGTCKITKLAGEVDMQHAGGIRPREVAAGSVLLCCSTPLSDVVLDA